MTQTPHVPPTVPPPPPGGSYTPPPPPPAGGPASSDRTLMLVLSYLGIFSLIPLLTKKEDSDIQWHAKNGLAFTIAWVIVWAIFFVIGFFMRGILAVAGCGLAAVECVIAVAFLVVDIMAMVKAVGGQRFRFPVITDFAEKM
jgi:uncharacterized membrane protein